jgi:hypothetical protein
MEKQMDHEVDLDTPMTLRMFHEQMAFYQRQQAEAVHHALNEQYLKRVSSPSDSGAEFIGFHGEPESMLRIA